MAVNKIDVRHCILFLFKLDKTGAETKIIDADFENFLLRSSTCCEWFAKFKKGECNL